MVPQEDLANLEHLLHKPVNFIILPLFALANTAIPLDISLLKQLGSSLSAGIFFGLFFGKPIGILLACKMMVHKKMAMLPDGIKWGHLAAAGILAGIGFTMSIFIASLAFTDTAMQDVSKLTILVSSVLSIFFVIAWMWFINRKSETGTEITGESNIHHLA
jgi:NhaA family Na+:H+ antiporter